MVENADAILTSGNTAMVSEIREWVEKYRAFGEMGRLYVDMESNHQSGKSLDSQVRLLGSYKAAEAGIAKNARLVSHYVLTPFFASLNSRFAILLGQVDEITCAPATPYTNCDHYRDYKADYMTDGDDTTYFWTAGTMNQAAGGKTGYFGVDVGQVTDVTNIYFATGVGGSDILREAVVEYSADGKTWTTVYEGACNAETLLSGLSLKARYVRVRNGNPSATDWTKVRSFEVNTTRTVVADPAGSMAVSTPLPTYQTYYPDLMTDGDENTYFWSGREGRVGDYIQLDLGSITHVTHITFLSGVPAHAADYIQNGELSYSTDGQSWTVICPVNSRDTVKDVDISARYVRVTVKADQTSWITVSEFSATGEDSVSPLLSLNTDTIPRADLMTLTDGHYVSYFAPDCKQEDGYTLKATFNESGHMTIIILDIPDTGLRISVHDASGKHLYSGRAEHVLFLEAPEGSTASILLGNGLMLAEILWTTP